MSDPLLCRIAQHRMTTVVDGWFSWRHKLIITKLWRQILYHCDDLSALLFTLHCICHFSFQESSISQCRNIQHVQRLLSLAAIACTWTITIIYDLKGNAQNRIQSNLTKYISYLYKYISPVLSLSFSLILSTWSSAVLNSPGHPHQDRFALPL